eukprot:TRINITY_DN89367_c0_g1_i1.p1 TRINITY_DN89367_c0_g1~~TRINITY_DN89367_c0_g1_i1.p1  ORF type:complete len:345 (+),score=85.28 TRINITY_DN89367_c0_g1_i1:54-1037(+)
MRLKLYHATSRDAADSIMKQGQFRPGTHGFAGGAIYFSEHEARACRKYRNGRGNPDVTILCDVDVGILIEAEVHAMDKEKCVAAGGDSVKIRRHDVFAIYDPSRIQIIKINHLKDQPSLLSLLEQNISQQEVEQEIQHQQDLARRYAEWGRGRLLGSSSGDVVRGAVALREARLARFGAGSCYQVSSAAVAPFGGTGYARAADVDTQMPLKHMHKHADGVSQEGQESQQALLQAQQTNRELQESSQKMHQVQQEESVPTDGDSDELQAALQLSLQDEQVHQAQIPMEIGEIQLQQALFLSMQMTEEEEDEELQRALAMSMEGGSGAD